MDNKSFLIPNDLYRYIESIWVQETPLLTRLREETAKTPDARMQIGADQGRFLSMLVKLTGAKQLLEIGVFTGYSSTVMALALPEDGRILACDISEEYTNVARRYWNEAGISHKIDLRIAPAVETLDVLLTEGRTFDFCFIDADKPNYKNYFERAVKMVRPGGLIVIDNVLWSGRVIDQKDQTEQTIAIRELNELVANDPRVEVCLVPIGDGVTLARVL